MECLVKREAGENPAQTSYCIWVQYPISIASEDVRRGIHAELISQETCLKRSK